MSDLIQIWVENYGLIAIFLLMLSNGLASTPPSEITLALAGIMALTTKWTFAHTLLAGISGNLAGAYILYFIGYKVGWKWLTRQKWISNHIPADKILTKLAKKFKTDGAIWVGIFRCLPGIRSIISLPAGMIHMPHYKFFTYSLIGITIWVTLWESLGYAMGELWHQWSIYILTPLFLALGILLIIAKNRIKFWIEE